MDRTEAIKAAKKGAIAAVISGALTLAVVLFALITNAEGDIGLWNAPSNLFDVVLIFICAFGMTRKSRAAAVTNWNLCRAHPRRLRTMSVNWKYTKYIVSVQIRVA